MLENSSSRRKMAGFIRNSSAKALPTFKITQENQSSDQFSSFEYGKKDEEQNMINNFNYPEKQQKNTRISNKPPLPFKGSIMHRQKNPTIDYLQENSSPPKPRREESLTSSLKNSRRQKTNSSVEKWLAQERGKQQIEQNLAEAKKICDKIHEMRISNSTQNFRNEFSHQFAQQVCQHKQTKKMHKNIVDQSKVNYSKPSHHLINKLPYEFSESSLSKASGQEEQSFQIQTEFNQKNNKSSIKLREKNEHPQNILKSQNKSARNKFIFDREEMSERTEDREELIIEHHVRDFKDKLKQCVIERKTPKRENTGGVLKTKGGICFHLDINDFHQSIKQKEKVLFSQPIKKPKKVNTKEEILKRRQMAKNYDKVARMRVFANY